MTASVQTIQLIIRRLISAAISGITAFHKAEHFQTLVQMQWPSLTVIYEPWELKCEQEHDRIFLLILWVSADAVTKWQLQQSILLGMEAQHMALMRTTQWSATKGWWIFTWKLTSVQLPGEYPLSWSPTPAGMVKKCMPTDSSWLMSLKVNWDSKDFSYQTGRALTVSQPHMMPITHILYLQAFTLALIW